MLLRRRADTLLLQKTDRCRNNLDCRHVPKYKYLHNHFVNLAHNRIFMTSGKKTRCVSVSETHCALAIATLLTGWTDTQASARYLKPYGTGSRSGRCVTGVAPVAAQRTGPGPRRVAPRRRQQGRSVRTRRSGGPRLGLGLGLGLAYPNPNPNPNSSPNPNPNPNPHLRG